jgi:hypothetical protein
VLTSDDKSTTKTTTKTTIFDKLFQKCYSVVSKIKTKKGREDMRKQRIMISLTDSQVEFLEQEAKAKGLTKSSVIAILIEGGEET